jgi:hypothetical protein
MELQERSLATASRSRMNWTTAEIVELIEFHTAGFELVEIARYFNRTYFAIANMLYVLNSSEPAAVHARSNKKRITRNSQAPKPACASCHIIHPLHTECF